MSNDSIATILAAVADGRAFVKIGDLCPDNATSPAHIAAVLVTSDVRIMLVNIDGSALEFNDTMKRWLINGLRLVSAEGHWVKDVIKDDNTEGNQSARQAP